MFDRNDSDDRMIWLKAKTIWLPCCFSLIYFLWHILALSVFAFPPPSLQLNTTFYWGFIKHIGGYHEEFNPYYHVMDQALLLYGLITSATIMYGIFRKYPTNFVKTWLKYASPEMVVLSIDSIMKIVMHLYNVDGDRNDHWNYRIHMLSNFLLLTFLLEIQDLDKKEQSKKILKDCLEDQALYNKSFCIKM